MPDTPHSPVSSDSDVLIIGGGAAGLSLALKVAEQARVTILSKSSLDQGSTYYAQGGIAAVLDEHDSHDSHVEDTLAAGDGLCDREIVEYTVSRGRECIEWLVEQGVKFTREQEGNSGKDYHLSKEGGHSHRRVVHAADATGKAVFKSLAAQVMEHPNITFRINTVAVDLITTEKLGTGDNRCVGAYVLNEISGQVSVHRARFVILATGGASKTYLYTSNPDGASGDGIAMAWRAGCRIANMEFNQFHPTCLYHPEAKSFLITEALRGEGGLLRLPDGARFMDEYDKRGELAPRDIVARAIDSEKIPVVPAAHYSCGGVMVDKHGKTDVENVYAIGETSFTGLHGANRMASNSLLECFVFAFAAAEDILEKLDNVILHDNIPAWDESQVTDSDEDVVIAHNWDEVRRFMWDYVGIVRTNKRLQRAQNRIELLQQEIKWYYSKYRVSRNLLELRNLALVSELIIQSALNRKESRGLHFTLDYPDKLPSPENTILVPDNFHGRSF
jgi:L-aspartate oxidase